MQIQQGQFSLNNEGNTGLYDPTSGSSCAGTFTGSVAGNFFLGIRAYSAQFNRSWYRSEQREIGVFPG